MTFPASQRNALELAREGYRSIALYSPDRTPATIDLSDNTNLWGVPPNALRALRSASERRISRYPSLYTDGLKEAIARYTGVHPENIVTGCGSDDVLDSAMRAYCEQGATVVSPDPSFAMIPLLARMNGLASVEVPLTSDLDINADSMLRAGAAVTYICSPNNPVGNRISDAAIRQVVGDAPGMVIIDEAYCEFAGFSYAQDAVTTGNTLVVRTMSKAFGLAGLRVGYAIGAPETVREVEKARGPYKVSSLGEEVATVALTDDLDWVASHVRKAIENRERLIGELRAMSLSPIPSASNFVLVPVPDAAAVAARMRASGVAVRPFSGLAVVGDAIRISVGPWEMLSVALSTLQESLV